MFYRNTTRKYFLKRMIIFIIMESLSYVFVGRLLRSTVYEVKNKVTAGESKNARNAQPTG